MNSSWMFAKKYCGVLGNRKKIYFFDYETAHSELLYKKYPKKAMKLNIIIFSSHTKSLRSFKKKKKNFFFFFVFLHSCCGVVFLTELIVYMQRFLNRTKST